MYYNIDMESEKNYFKQLSKKPIPKFNFHHADNQKENILKNKAKVQKKQSWIIDKKYKTNYLNTTKNIILIAIITLPLLLFMYASYKFTTLGAIIIFSPFVCFLISFLLLASFLKDILK